VALEQRAPAKTEQDFRPFAAEASKPAAAPGRQDHRSHRAEYSLRPANPSYTAKPQWANRAESIQVPGSIAQGVADI
jgi:hypothetical protein